MPAYAYRTQPFSTTHENRAFDELYDHLLRVWGDSEDTVVLLGNFFCQGSEIDAAIIKRDSISVVEMKDYGGRISFSENGSWYADDTPVRGGSKRNPYIQLRDNKYALLNFLRDIPEWPSRQLPELGHISAIALFHQEIEFDRTQLSKSVKPWFHVVDMGRIAQTLCQITSPSINLTPEDIGHLVNHLDVPEYRPPGVQIVQHKRPRRGVGELGDVVQAALNDVDEFVQSDRRILVMTGSVGSGRGELEDVVRACGDEHGRPVVMLAPNRRLTQTANDSMESIYSHVYMKNPNVEDETVLVYPLNVNHDPSDCIYLITHAHLVSDSMWETDFFRYGSGCLLSDFLAWADLEDKNRKVIFSGDPYQLPRGDSDKTAVAVSYVGSCANGAVDHLEFPVPELGQAKGVLLRNSIRLAWCLQNEVYSSFRMERDGDECVDLPEERQDRADRVSEIIGTRPYDSKFVGFSNGQVSRVNNWIRGHVFGLHGELAAGDLVHIHNSPVCVDSDPFEEGGRLEGNSWAEVAAVDSEIDPVVQPLRGRNEAIRVEFLKVQLRPLQDAQSHWVYVFKDYLRSEKPELSVDSVLALRVRVAQERRKGSESRSQGGEESSGEHEVSAGESGQSEGIASALQKDPLLNAAQIRLGYAMTLHRAQGTTIPRVVADADTGQGQKNASYFRWLYTLLQTPEETLWLANAPEFNPLSEAKWNFSKTRLDTVRPKNLVPYKYTGENVDQSSALRALHTQTKINLSRVSLSLEAEEQKPYQLLWTIADSNRNQCKLRAHYDKKCRITRFEVVTDSDENGAAKAIEALSAGHEPDGPDRRLIYEEVQARLEPSGVIVVAIVGESYKDTYYVSGSNGKAEIAFYYNSVGEVTSCEAVRHEDSEILETVRMALCGTDVS